MGGGGVNMELAKMHYKGSEVWSDQSELDGCACKIIRIVHQNITVFVTILKDIQLYSISFHFTTAVSTNKS